jgi:hypothetical protein
MGGDMVQVRFVGGPFDGQTNEVPDPIDPDAVIYWPPGAMPGNADDDVPSDDRVTEYIYKEDGTAHYVGGLVEDDAPAP